MQKKSTCLCLILDRTESNFSSAPPVSLDYGVSGEEEEEELPNDMRFNSAHVISIVGYSALFMVSSVANLTVLNILLRRFRKNKSRVNLLLINLV